MKDFQLGVGNGVTINYATSTTSLADVANIQFYRILDNLIRNAFDAVDPFKGQIEVIVESHGNLPTLTVRDNGCGISAENLSKIFDAEFTTKQSRGTGLGLSIVKKLCDDLSAELKVKSVLGVGTEFQIRFRIADSEVAQRRPSIGEAIL